MMILIRLEKHELMSRTKYLLNVISRPCITGVWTQRCRKCSSRIQNRQDQSFSVTTPIFYVNAAPHMGHLYTCVLADAVARYHRLKGKQILFSTGTDEHGLKIQQAADQSKESPALFTTNVSRTFKEMFDCYNISYTDYIRTTEQRHFTTVQKFWTELETRGYIYKGSYEGWYSVSDEAFLTEVDVTEVVNKKGEKIMVSKESGNPVTWMKEDNYMFKLSEFSDRLHKWLDTGVIQPAMFTPIAQHWLSNPQDLSVSRPSSRLSWGIPVPGDSSQTIYVWLDALVNYLTVCGYPSLEQTWPADVQVIGKDILKFHAIYWPAFLMAAGLELPKKIFCHSHWLINCVKMSKSLGNVVDPMVVKEKYSAEVFRYYLLREGVPHSDGNYLEEKAMEYVNSDVVNTFGNLLSRCTASAINRDQIYPRKDQDTYISSITAADRETFENIEILIDTVEGYYQDMMMYKAIESIMSYLRWANGLVENHKIWDLAKSDQEADVLHLKCVLHLALDTLRVSGILLQPVIPNISERLLNRLGIPKDRRTFECARKPYLNSPELPLGPNEGVLLKRLKIN
ncbi:methionine--tRNA ligase, mitochondrial-like [Ruditapes philippinarum]|uniref:methionine--tRNA ligase, mitochondrial-like n=2 Tax=Ruditapes philippinarum TaxID=129788 RepID=UPI00295A9280|nr:methionine--tRNA ligase, mitochondrial-like [Ruditapes philippinarum]